MKMIGFGELKYRIKSELTNFKENDTENIRLKITELKSEIGAFHLKGHSLSDKAFFETFEFRNETFEEKREILLRYLNYSKNFDDLYVIILECENLFL